MFSFSRDCWFLTGPTASGKTTIGLKLAQILNAEIISMDSMAVYREMDIGTAKPNESQRNVVPHHLINIRNPNELFSVSDFVELAEKVTTQILANGRQVLFVGGTPLYLKAMLRGLFDGPPADADFRQEIQDELEKVGIGALHKRLELIDPLSAAKLHANDVRRIIRALEVYRATGQPISHLQLEFDEAKRAEECRVFALDWPRAILHQRIEDRVDQMFELGFVDEVRNILEQFESLSKTANQAVGYQEIQELLRGNVDLTRTIELTKIRTRQFAKRQDTWFRNLVECRKVSRNLGQSPSSVAESISELAIE